MPKKFYATPEYRDTLEAPRPGENVDSGDVNAPFQILLNNDAFLRSQISELYRRLDQMTVNSSSFILSLPLSVGLEPSREYVLTDSIGITRNGGYAGNIDLQVLDVPAGVSVVLNPDPVAGDKASMTINTDVNLVPGLYTVTVRGTGPDGKIAESKMTFNVVAQTQQPSFSVSAVATASIDRASGATTATVPVSVNRAGLFDQPINLTITNLPAGLTATWSANPVTGNQSQQQNASTLTLTAAASLPTGTYSLNLRADGGGIVRTLPITLTIGAPAVAGGGADIAAEFVYDNGDPAVTNGGTLYINRLGGFTGPVMVRVGVESVPTGADGTIYSYNGMKYGSVAPPYGLVNGSLFVAEVNSNTARITADGTSMGWNNSGVAKVVDDSKPDYPYTSSYRGPWTRATISVQGTINGQEVIRLVPIVIRVGTRAY